MKNWKRMSSGQIKQWVSAGQFTTYRGEVILIDPECKTGMTADMFYFNAQENFHPKDLKMIPLWDGNL